MKKNIVLSVHQLVDFLLRSGDIDSRIFNMSTMEEGTRLHSIYQSKQGLNYLSEVPLCECFSLNGFDVTLQGKADGIIVNKNSVTIEEIKTTIDDLETFFKKNKKWHLGQAYCYALMYAHRNNLDRVQIRLVYINQLSSESMSKTFRVSTKTLEEKIHILLSEYIEFYSFIYSKYNSRNKSAIELNFPFPKLRKGQKKLVKTVYDVGLNGGKLFCEAPTGIGKTISTIYPFIKTFDKCEVDKIFYLTAKTSGRESAFNAVTLLKKEGLCCSQLVLTAKDKICFCKDAKCNPDECPFAKNYYNKIKKALFASLMEENDFDYNAIVKYAKKFRICPFEFSLDLALYCDVIICDYNYVFDPQVYLKRFFEENTLSNLLLVDEAHNLVERGRNMYSASLSYDVLLNAYNSCCGIDYRRIKNSLTKALKIFDPYIERNQNNSEQLVEMLSSEELSVFNKVLLTCQKLMKDKPGLVADEITEVYFMINKFFKILNFYDSSFRFYLKNNSISREFVLFCIDPSEQLSRCINMFKSTVLFSATLVPIDYYKKMILNEDDVPYLKLESPFDYNKLNVMVANNISLKYKDRNKTKLVVADYIDTFVSQKVGNYLIFLPSYEYLELILPFLKKNPSINYVVQTKDMSLLEKDAFINNFVENPQKTTVGIGIIGGSFSEGIDLVGSRLIGVGIIGIGLPQICFERELIKDYFDVLSHNGFVYSYLNPGINRVTQAVGRLIRSESDKGSVLLIDNRYLNSSFKDLFENDWRNYKVISNSIELKNCTNEFWKTF